MPNPSSEAFDQTLKEISHYKSFPAMLPFVGQDYVSANHSKLLIFGESFYFPAESTIHKDPSRWYASNQDSLDEHHPVSWIDCRGLLECEWSQPGHKMYREINSCLKELGLPSQDRPVSHICFTNTFMRPATEGKANSFKFCCVDQDVEVSVSTLSNVMAILAPDMVIFASKYAWERVGLKIAKQHSEIDFVYHPTDHWHWNTWEHGKKKFMSLLRKWVVKTG